MDNRKTTQIWVVTCHQYGISALVSQPSFSGETSGSVAKCRLFSQAVQWRALFTFGTKTGVRAVRDFSQPYTDVYSSLEHT